MFFDNWNDLVRIVVVGGLAYGGLILMLRISGKRTLSKMNAFDFVVTIALGSTLASGLLSSEVSLSESLTAFALLCILQFAVTWLSVRSPRFQSLIKAEPSLVFFRGKPVSANLRRARLTEEEILAAIRESGRGDIEHVEAVVLETDGTLSVIDQGRTSTGSLRNVSTP